MYINILNFVLVILLQKECSTGYSIYGVATNLYLGQSTNYCKSWIFVSIQNLDNADQIQDIVFPSINIRTSFPTDNRSTTFPDKLYSSEDILQPLALGVFRHTPNCVSIFIDTTEVAIALKMTTFIRDNKLGRLHKDFFMYIGPSSVVGNVLLSQYAENIRFKYGIPIDSNNHRIAPLKTCQRRNENLELFSRKCFSLISGKNFKVSAVFSTSLVRITKEKIGGYQYLVLRDASMYHNFTIDVRVAGFGGASGFVDSNGTWCGTVGEVLDRSADMSLAAGMTVHRHFVQDASAAPRPTWFNRVFIVRTPPARISWDSLGWPLSRVVWILLGITIILLIPVFFAFVRKEVDQSRTNFETISQVINLIYRILLEQSTAKQWFGIRLRFLIYLWMFICLVVATAYRCQLVSFLTSQEPEEAPRTHAELSLSDYDIYFRNYGGVAYKALMESQDPVQKKFRSRIKLVNSSHDCVVLAALNVRSACLDYRTNSEFSIASNATLFVNRDESIFLKSKDTSYSTVATWGFRKSSPLTETFDQILLWSLAFGMFEYHAKVDVMSTKLVGSEWLKTTQKGSLVRDQIISSFQDKSNGARPLSLTSLIGILSLLAIGSVLGMVICLTELFTRCRSPKPKLLV